MQADFAGLRTVVSEHSTETWDFIKYGGFHWLLKSNSATSTHSLSHNRQLTKRNFSNVISVTNHIWRDRILMLRVLKQLSSVRPSVQMYKIFIKFDIENCY